MEATRYDIGSNAPAGKVAGLCRRFGAALMLLVFLAGLQCLLPAPVLAADGLTATEYKMAGDATRMRIVLNFDGEPSPHWFLLRAPHRLVIDLPSTEMKIATADLKARGLVAGVRYGKTGEGNSRLVISGKGPFLVDRLDVLENEDGAGHRLAVEISAASDRQFEEALAEQALTTASTVAGDKGDRRAKTPLRRFTVVLDPGHGGVDGGAEGISGTQEKEVTLAFARELKAKLDATRKYDVMLTRDSDVFLRLDERVRIARQNEADLFISIHADTIRLKGIRGATVYTVSDKASDAEAQALAERENLADQLGGIEVKVDSPEVADILFDLIRRETHSFSMSFANTLVGELSTTVGLINNPHRFAGFKVLRAPDVPSVLVELGYLSNPEDEAQLINPEWRDKAASSIINAIAAFASAKAAAGG
ncbi:N-acetylmuramoyl-L-alanine amidase [Aquamicrobium terrae]|uniref:N-acetylmuramoyl-L-alanine amidase n=1 Tax=Aquamicrobium terrae TaxID=1324945 RepID=A0ABV2MX47_9HYPH